MTEPPSTVVVVPLKAFDRAKHRLAGALDGPERAALAESMADAVLRAASPLPVLVVHDDTRTATWARERGAMTLRQVRPGLDAAVTEAVHVLAADGVAYALVAHGDLPLATELATLAGFEGVTLVPDRRRDGTNVLVVPTDAGFRFAYGPQSFTRHLAEAGRLGLPVRTVEDPALAWDVDDPSDLNPMGSRARP